MDIWTLARIDSAEASIWIRGKKENEELEFLVHSVFALDDFYRFP